MNNLILKILSLIWILIQWGLSNSNSVMIFQLFTLFLGIFIINVITKNICHKKTVKTVFLISFLVLNIFTTIRWLGIECDFNTFADENNDNYKFWLATNNLNEISISKIYKECIIDNIYLENGGYFFYIRMLGYLAESYFDGNHILLQQLGTAFPSVLSSIFLYFLSFYICNDYKQSYNYACTYILLTPLITISTGITRDAIIAFFYLLLIYLWFTKELSLKVVVVELLIMLILMSFRMQHGLFASAFIVMTIITSNSSNRWLYYLALLVLVINIGLLIYSFMINHLADTIDYYIAYRADELEGLNSGIGRYVYALPTPIKELAQILFLQLQFPPWYDLIKSTNVFYSICGVLNMVISFYWFYIFYSVIINLYKFGYKQLPKKYLFAIIIFFIFILLNTSNLSLRRVVCIYPLLYLVYVYFRTSSFYCINYRHIKKQYLSIYLFLIVSYLGASFVLG